MPDGPLAHKDRPSTWPYRADPPQRYWGLYQRYQERGGLVDLEEDIRGFVANGYGVGDISRFYFFCLAFDQIHKDGLLGDLAELGVYRGHTATLLARIARRLGRHAYLLDTFEGFDKSDLQGYDANQPIQFTDTSVDAVRRLVGEDNVSFIKGHFPDSAKALPETSYCLVHIDCDLYAPISSALNYFYPRLVPGGFLIVHDYSSLCWDGAERAVDEFFADKPEAIIPLTDGAGSVVIRKTRAPSANPVSASVKGPVELSTNWMPASAVGVGAFLGTGWSNFEAWGVWAIGPLHELKIGLPSHRQGDFVLECDVHAPLLGPIQEQTISLFVAEQQIGEWHFTKDLNRDIRTVRIPEALVPVTGDPFFLLTLKPLHIVQPADVNGRRDDVRPLSMALHKIRRGAI
jgi:hypothetical protein